MRHASPKVQICVLGILSFAGVAAIVYNLLMWDAPLEYLPLHLCSVNAMLLPFAVFTRNRTLCNLLMVWCLGALAALILNYEMAASELFSGPFWFYYFPHVMEFGIPILLFRLGLVEKSYRCIGSTLTITMLIYTGIHLINKLINGWCLANQFSYNGTDVVKVNYMFSIEPTNPLSALFYSVIPCEYWYMYMVVPIVALYLLAVYSPQLLARRKAKKAAPAA
ncbi:MAG: YwaF family protein [Oscillospiraceae bacterium]|nr:YwaF family protein [Oscillospiraceae bacterium]